MSKILYTVDEYGIRNYRSWPVVVMAFAILYSSIGVLAAMLLFFEHGEPGANIKTYKDAFWTLQMAASTIGFGDYYPTTIPGRWCTSLMFYIGVGIVGALGAVFHKKLFGFTDTGVQNRELRAHLQELLEHNRKLEGYLLSDSDGPSIEIEVKNNVA